MSARRLLDALASGRPVFGTALRTSDPAIVEIIAVAGYDWVSITLEHSSLTLRDVAALQRAADVRGITTLVHLPHAHDDRVLPLLDEGVGGVVASHVESAADVRALVHAARFPPLGERGAAGVVRRADYGAIPFGEFAARADAEIVVGAVLETATAIEHAEEILAVPGLTLAYVGMHDLTLSLGYPGEFHHPRVLEATEHVIAAARERGVFIGLSAKGHAPQELWRLGVQAIITPTGEYALLLEAFRSAIETARAAIDEVRASEVHDAV
jgi:4-hydroxy-2-oxoheptanedioate aldolase